MKQLQPSGIILSIAVACTLLLSGCNDDSHQEKQANAAKHMPVKVSTATVQMKPAKLQIEIMGTVEPVHSAVIATKVSGNITELSVELGSAVKSGDTLIKLEAGELNAKLEQAKAQLAQAKRNLARDEKLLSKKAATPETVKAQRDMVRIAEAAYQEASTMIDYTNIEAPFDGLITKKMVNLGDLVTPGRPLLQVDNHQDLQIITNIPENLLLSIRQGDELPITIPALNLSISAKVKELAPTADPTSRTALMKLTVSPMNNLRPGQFARVHISSKTVQSITIPKSAIFPSGQLERVFTVQDGRAKLRLVRTGNQDGETAEILSGLEPGETVVSQASGPLMDNQPVILQ